MDMNALAAEARTRAGPTAGLGAIAAPGEQDLLALVAHELRGPLEAISMAAGVAARSPLADVQKRAVQRIERQAEQMAWLIKDLLDIGRANTGRLALRLQPLEFREVVDAAFEIARPLMEARQHRLTVAPAARVLSLVADRVRLTQVIGNLLLSLAQCTEPRGQLRLTSERSERLLLITLSDTGHRVRPQGAHRLRGTEVRGDLPRDEDPSAGVGMALTRRLVSLHGGRLETSHAVVGRGARYCVTLPQ